MHCHFSPTHTLSFLSLIPFVSVQCCAYADKLLLPEEWWEYECLSLWLTDRLVLPLIIGVLFPTINSFQLSLEHIDPLSLTPHVRPIHTHTHTPPTTTTGQHNIYGYSCRVPEHQNIDIYRTWGLRLETVWNNVILWYSTIPFSCCPFLTRYLEPQCAMILNLGLELGQLLEYTFVRTQ